MSAFRLKKSTLALSRNTVLAPIIGVERVDLKPPQPRLVRVSFGNPHLWEILKAVLGGGTRG